MEHGYAGSKLDGLKEFMGQPDEIIDFIGDAGLLVTHLAPISRSMLARLPKLKFIAVSRGGPVNIDMQAARDHNVLVVNTPGRNASAVAEFTVGAILAETRLIRSGHEALRGGESRGDLYRADRTGRPLTFDDVPNGIAYVPERGTLLLTGKRWPTLFEVKVPGVTAVTAKR